MYKKITHTIVEEHFDHPMATEIKRGLAKKVGAPTSTIFDSAAFRSDAANLYTNYATRLMAVLDASTDAGLLTSIENMFVDIDDIGNITKNFYQNEMGERLNISMRTLPVLLLLSLQALRYGKEGNTPTWRWNQWNNELSSNITAFNPNIGGDIRIILDTVVMVLHDIMKAKAAKNAEAESQAKTTLNTEFSRFYNTFIDGLFEQFPERFIGGPTPVTSRNRNIM